VCYAVGGENENHAVFGESDCYAVSPSDAATGLAALNAEIRTAGSGGGRTIAMENFHISLGNILEPDEIITHISIPHPKTDSIQRFLKFRPREAIDFATVSLASVITRVRGRIADVKMVLGGVSPAPYEAVRAREILLGEVLTEELAEMAAAAVAADAMPLSKNGYKVPLVKALIKRSLLDTER
jgi:xanthine dehydrogenase YagS FAD-binding subunit